jgi:diguanylate cyclase (GGDEF)-like protein
MAASNETWASYGALIERLLPQISHSLLADADGSLLWAGSPAQALYLQSTLAILQSSATNRVTEIDGLADPDSSAPAFGFRVRGSLGELLGFLVVAIEARGASAADLPEVHAALKPALDCLQSELAARAAIGHLHANLADKSRNLGLFRRLSDTGVAGGCDALAQIPALALEHLPGILAVVMVPDRNLTICRTEAGQPAGIEADLLAQLHRHLMTRAQLHRCTLVANRLVLDGSNATLPYKVISTPIRDELRRVIGVLAVFRAVSAGDFELRDAEVLELLARKGAEIARTSFDFNTGLLTQTAFLAQAQARLAAQPVGACGASGLLYIDIDQLNVVNENHGMPVGDEVIQGVAAILARRSRPGTLVARIAGDRFAMFVPGCSIEPAARIAEELRAAAIKLSGTRGDKHLLVSLSIGVSRIVERDRSLEHGLAGAELACRAAKERGRNRVEVFYGNEQEAPSARRPASLGAQVAAAIAGNALELLVQPIMPLGAAPADPRFEVMLRMRAADGTRLSYDKMVGAAECAELSRSIDSWVVEQAIGRLVANRGLLQQYPAQFSINLSQASLGDPDFWRGLEEQLRGARLETGTLCFEFPEEAANDRLAAIAPFMRRLGEQGVSFAVDNFGRGISSLVALNALPVSCIKIDGALIRDLLVNPRAQSMVMAITKLAAGFRMETIATQVETDAHRARAAQLGVEFGQGFFIGKPLYLDDAIRDLPLYSCFGTSTGLFDSTATLAAMRGA